MWSWKKKAVSMAVTVAMAEKQDTVVYKQCERIADDDGAAVAVAVADDPAIEPAPAVAVADDPAIEPAPAVAPETAEVPNTVTIEKVYEHLIMFDLSGLGPFVKNADPVDLANDIAMFETIPMLFSNRYPASMLARNHVENPYENVVIGQAADNDLTVRLPHVNRERQQQQDEQRRFPNGEGQFQDDNERPFLDGCRHVRSRANDEDDDENGAKCFHCFISKGTCSII